uniref:Potassium channel toxin kappa-KTx 2.5 n=1 Tax=Opisthacanthus cayaporum TaxID=573324 RepID=KKX25_OPICY
MESSRKSYVLMLFLAFVIMNVCSVSGEPKDGEIAGFEMEEARYDACVNACLEHHPNVRECEEACKNPVPP